MVTKIPNKLYPMESKYKIIKENAERYRKGSKKFKKQMLDELEEIVKMDRQYISFLLRNTGKKVVLKGRGIVLVGEYTRERLSKRGRKKEYGKEIERALVKIWGISGFISSKHLVEFIRLNSDILFSHKEIKRYLDREIEEKLKKISGATADRILKDYRDKWKIKKKYKTNPYSSNLKRSIKVESWYDKKKEKGDIEIDLVHHSGEVAEGQFIYTLTATEITSGWTELIPIRNKAMVWTMDALRQVIQDMPISVKKIHTDNGSEFINSYVQKFCEERGIEFRRSRPYRKNDAAYVESKNWSMVRVYTGWRRYDSQEELEVLKQLTNLISIRHNIFLPQMKIIDRHRENGKIKKKYEIDTPFNRIIKDNNTEEKIKEKLISLRNSVDIVKLTKTIEDLKNKLDKIYQTKRGNKNA
ncbi:MAG: transposase family protein [Candidatus Omnitrophota bacterium]